MLVSCVIRSIKHEIAGAQLFDTQQAPEMGRLDDLANNERELLWTIERICVFHLCRSRKVSNRKVNIKM